MNRRQLALIIILNAIISLAIAIAVVWVVEARKPDPEELAALAGQPGLPAGSVIPSTPGGIDLPPTATPVVAEAPGEPVAAEEPPATEASGEPQVSAGEEQVYVFAEGPGRARVTAVAADADGERV